MDRTDFVGELWGLYHNAAANCDWADALMLLKEICEHEPKKKDDDTEL